MGALGTVIDLCLEGLDFSPSHLIDRLSGVPGNVELVVVHFRVRRLLRYRIGIGGKHVGSNRPNLLPLLNRQRLGDALGSHLSASRA